MKVVEVKYVNETKEFYIVEVTYKNWLGFKRTRKVVCPFDKGEKYLYWLDTGGWLHMELDGDALARSVMTQAIISRNKTHNCKNNLHTGMKLYKSSM